MAAKRAAPASPSPAPQLETACVDVFMSLRNERLADAELQRPSIQVFLISSQTATPIRDLSARPGETAAAARGQLTSARRRCT